MTTLDRSETMTDAAWTRDRVRSQAARARPRVPHPPPVQRDAQQRARRRREQIRGWVANRFYYQIAIPIKDAAVLSNCPDREVRRGWVQRILDHDGFEIGGVEGRRRHRGLAAPGRRPWA